MKTIFFSNLIIRIILISALLLPIACNDFIDVGPPKTRIVSQTVFENEASASSALAGVYSLMMTNNSFTRGAIEEYTGIAGDELTNYSTSVNRLQFYQNALTTINSDVLNVFWGEAYKYISNANVILEGLDRSVIPLDKKNKLIGEALFVRAFCHFYLTNLFGDIPYVTSSNYDVNSKAPRNAFDQVMVNIESDLLKARELMPADFSISAGERIRPNKDAATALLARVNLFRGKWANAEALASEIINNTSTYSLLSNLNNVFLANSKEAIWQLRPVAPSTGAPQATFFVLTAPPNGVAKRVAMSPQLIGAFDVSDQRKSNWTRIFSSSAGSWQYMFKYRTTTAPTEYSMILRLAEQFLIRAEARTQLGNFDGARSDVNIIRARAVLPGITFNTKDELLAAILQERRVELFGEFGHRWLDLKRTGTIDATLSPIKPQWQVTDSLFPIPNSERLINPNLTQNPGY